ncbi:MAG TPA: hypothetical protein VE377_11260 [Candidatus Dormibacteraeota bacterium]|nr:hypothetical protein [Candidatus Dormibacteraeota bacterium]
MPVRKLWYLPAVVLTGCVACMAQGQFKGATALTGNWHLTGSWTMPLADPRLTVSLEVDGENVRGGGDLQSFCETDHTGSGTSFFLAGKVSADGSFVLTDPSFSQTTSKSRNPISISGTLPAPGSKQWSGRFYFPPMGRSQCAGEFTGEFTATPLPALKGVYTGKLNLADYSTALVTIEVDQGERVSLTAKLSVGKWSKFPAQAPTAYISDPSSSYVSGDEVFLSFPADNGAGVKLMGSFTDASAQRLQFVVSNLRAGPAGSALDYIGVRLGGAGVLTRQ